MLCIVEVLLMVSTRGRGRCSTRMETLMMDITKQARSMGRAFTHTQMEITTMETG